MPPNLPEMSKRQKTTLAVLSAAVVVVFYLSAIIGLWLIVLVFPIAYAIVVVRNWHKP